MKDYIGHIDTSLMSDEMLDPAWAGHDRAIGDVQKIIVHHEAEIEGTVYDDKSRYEAEAAYQAQNPTINGLGLQYHYKIDNVGQIMQIRPLTMTLWHAANLDVNNHSVAICLDGNFEEQMPTREQFEALKQLLDNICTQHPEFPAVQSDVYAHSEVSQLGTACCGKNLRPYVQEYRNTGGNPSIPDVPYQHPEMQAQAPTPSEPTPVPVTVIPQPVEAQPSSNEVPDQMNPSPTPAPTPAPVSSGGSAAVHPKVTAAAIAGAITTILVTVLGFANISLDAGVVAALTTIIAAAAGYLTSTN